MKCPECEKQTILHNEEDDGICFYSVYVCKDCNIEVYKHEEK